MAQTFRLRRKDFSFYLVRSESWISDGKWAVRRECVSNRALFESDAALQAWTRGLIELKTKTDADFSAFFSGERKPFTITIAGEYLHGYHGRFLVTDGDASLADNRYLRLFRLENGARLYARDGIAPLSDGQTEAESTFLIMPMKKDADAIAGLKRWLVPTLTDGNQATTEVSAATVGALAP